MVKQICNNCFGVYEARRASAKYCSAACNQQAYRKRHGQPDRRIFDAFGIKERITCKHCHEAFYWSGKGRKPKFCRASCRVMNNRKLVWASAQFVMAMNGQALGWTMAECERHVKDVGTTAIINWAKSAGWEYSASTHRFWKKSIPMWETKNA